MSLDFLRIDGALIHKVGLDAAVLHALIDWRTRRRSSGVWVGSFADITDDTGLTRRRIQVARQTLIDAGFIRCVRGAQSSLYWSVIKPTSGPPTKPDVTRLRTDEAEFSSYREKTPKDKPPVVASLPTPREEPAVIDEPVLRALPDEPSDGGLFDAAAVTPPAHAPTPAEMGNECRQAWIRAYTEQHGRPFPLTKNRAMGQIGTAIKACEEPEDFRAVWRAATEAGRAGEWAVVNWIGPKPQSRYQRPHNVQLRLLTERAQVGDPAVLALNAYYQQRELGQ